MTKENLRIVFMGTPEFAVESLHALVENEYNIVGVVTMPDKPIGRHQDKLSQSAVKKYAVAHNLKVLQPKNLKDPLFQEELKGLKADLQIVVAFRMLPEQVWAMPPLGTFNLHASLLPKYRGAAPINWAIINGEKETGITTFFLTHKIDTGAIIAQEHIDILPDDNAEDIHDQLMTKGAKLVLKTVDDIIHDNVQTIDQALIDITPTPAPKIFKDTCHIPIEKSLEDVHNFIRGLSPYPAAWTLLHNGNKKAKTLKIYKTEKIYTTPSEPLGTVVIQDGHFDIAMTDGYLRVLILQLEGRQRMKVNDFLNGFHADENIHIE